MKKYLIGVDVGTTSIKTIICNALEYKVIASSNSAHHLLSPHPGWAEENPEDWWSGVKLTIKECLTKTGINPKNIAGLGITGMCPAFILLDKKGNVLRPSIQQNDARTYKQINYMRKAINEDEFFSITGCDINQQMIGPKILWVRENEPELFNKTDMILGSWDYIIYKLTGKYSVDPNWALEGGLYDINQKKWSGKLLEIAGVDSSYFPDIYQPAEIIGRVNQTAAKELGLETGTLVVACTTDSMTSTFMAGVQNEGDLLLKFGGAGDILFSIDKLITDKRLFIDYHVIEGKYILNGCMASSGSLLKWFIQQSFDESTVNYEKLDLMVEKIEAGSEGLVLLPYFIGEKTPIFDVLARGVIFGLTLHHTRYHIYHALLEAIGYGFYHHIEVFRELGFEPKRIIATNGGALSKIWGRIISNIIGYPINYLNVNPGSSMGAAFVAGMGAGCFKDWSEAKNFTDISDTIYPDKKAHEKYKKYFNIYKKLYLRLKDVFVELNEAIEKG